MNIKTIAAVLFASIRSSSCNFESISVPEKKENAINRSYQARNNIPGFTWLYGTDLKRNNPIEDAEYVGVNSTGYFYTDIDIYSSPFTEVSTLMLLKRTTHYFAGSYRIDTLNNYYKYKENGKVNDFDKHFDLDIGSISVRAKQYVNPLVNQNGHHEHSSSIMAKGLWPSSTETESHVTTSYGINREFSKSLTAGVNLADGVYVQGSNQAGLTFIYSKSTEIINSEPKITSSSPLPNATDSVFDYKYVGYGKTLTFSNYVLFEVKNDSDFHKNQYDANIEVNRIRSNVAWRGALWERRYPVKKELDIRFWF